MMTWDEYKAWVSTLAKENISYYCRGHATDTWKLQTSFHREAIHQKITLLDYLNKIIPEVNYQISAILNEIIDLNNDQILGTFLSLIQHHGFPTPLLDWTLSPYIAAYFAFREVKEQKPLSENIQIFIFDYIEWEKSFNQPINIIETTSEYVRIIRPYAKNNPRIIAQQGVFTVTNVHDMEQHIFTYQDITKKTFLYTVELSVKEKPHVMRELNLMGINEMTMFPGLGGICRSLKSRYFSPDTVGLTSKEWEELITKPEPINYLGNMLIKPGINALTNYVEPKPGQNFLSALGNALSEDK